MENHSIEVRDSLGLPAESRPWTQLPGVKLRGMDMTERARDVVDCAFAAARRRRPMGTPLATIIKDLWVNPSQSVKRRPWSMNGPPTVVTSSAVYSFHSDCTLSGDAHLRALGFPSGTSNVGEFSEAQLRDLAGECYSVPSITSLTYAVYLNPRASWWQKSTS